MPARVKEEVFWHNYFMRVLRERRIFQLPPLVAPSRPDTTSGAWVRAAAATEVAASSDNQTSSKAVATAPDAAPSSAPAGGSSRPGGAHSIELQEAEAEADTWLQLAATPTTYAGHTAATRRPRTADGPSSESKPSGQPAAATPVATAMLGASSLAATPAAASPPPKPTPPIGVSTAAKEPSTSTTPASIGLPPAACAGNVAAASGVADAAVGSGVPSEAGATAGSAPPGATSEQGAEKGASERVAVARAITDGLPGGESTKACTPEELEAKIAAELGMDDDDDDEEGLVSLELVDAEDLDAVLAEDDDV